MLQNKLNLKKEIKEKYYVGINNILVNNPLFKAKLFEFFDFDIERMFNVDSNDLKMFAEKYNDVSIPRSFLNEVKNLNLDKVYDDFLNSNTKILTFEDERYPKLLKNIEDFPLALFYKGKFENINFEKTLGVVGSRNGTEGAKQNLKRIISGFLNSDITIVSGLASGIDTASHTAAIENNLKTIAVIGSGLDFIYPRSNKKLYEKIEDDCGLIFSEYPFGYAPIPVNFPQRNRIITGLSKGVLIVEAKMKSGAMISARFALDQGRELMCMPGLITNPNCEGIYHLIKNGAAVITKTEDILEQLNWEISLNKKDNLNLSNEEKQIYNLIQSEEISFEGLKQKLNIGINELMVKLTEMELKGLIIQNNGIYYISGQQNG